MEHRDQLEMIRRKTRQRLLFSVITIVLYFSFALNWTGAGDALGRPLGESAVNGSLLMFASLILSFIALELLFLLLNRNGGSTRSGE